MLRNNRGQILTIIEILVVVAIIVAAGLMISRSYLGQVEGSKEPGAPATPQERAQGVDCMNNLRQLRYAIDMFQQENDRVPTSLAELASRSGISSSLLRCLVSGKEYSYDGAQGKVWCTTPGHESY